MPSTVISLFFFNYMLHQQKLKLYLNKKEAARALRADTSVPLEILEHNPVSAVANPDIQIRVRGSPSLCNQLLPNGVLF